MARSFLGGEFAGGESAWWRGDWIPMLHGITKNILNFKDRLIVAKSNGKNHDKMINDLNFDVLFTIAWLFVALMTL